MASVSKSTLSLAAAFVGLSNQMPVLTKMPSGFDGVENEAPNNSTSPYAELLPGLGSANQSASSELSNSHLPVRIRKGSPPAVNGLNRADRAGSTSLSLPSKPQPNSRTSVRSWPGSGYIVSQ